MSLHFTSYRKGRFFLGLTDEIASDQVQVALVCGTAPLPVFYELKQLFYNFVDYLRARSKLNINLHVIAPPIGANVAELAKYIKRYVEDEGIDKVVVANDALAQYWAGDSAYLHLNYIVPRNGSNEPYTKGLPFNPFDVQTVYTVPSTQWLRAGKNIKTEGAGVNLLGYVIQAIKHVVLGYTEVDIRYLHNKKKYPVKPTIIRTIEQFDRLLKKLRRAKYVAIDTEGANLHKVKNTLFTIQFCIAANATEGQNLFVLPIEHRETPWTGEELRYIKSKLRHWFTTPCSNKMHIYQNAKFDLIMFINQLDVQWFAAPVYDTMAGVFSLDENTKFLRPAMQVKGFALETIEARAGFTRPAELVISKEDRANMARFTLEEIAEYGAYDVLTIYHITFKQIKAARNRGYQGFARLITQQLGAMTTMFAFMEARGILVDKEYLQQLASPIGPLADRINDTLTNLYDTKEVKKANKKLLKQRKGVTAGGGLFANKDDPFIFNIGNAQSLQTLFFDVCGLEPLNEQKGGGGSVDKKFQKQYKDVKVVGYFANYQKLVKLKSAFADAILKVLNGSPDALFDGRVRPSYWYTTVLTGRSSSSDFNAQQIPAKGEDAKIIKKQFIAAPGKVYVKPDFSAHEIRVTGIVSGDKVIKKTFRIANEAIRNLRIAGDNYLEEARQEYKKNGDIHILNVRFFYNGKEVDADHPLRQDVKITVFQTIYGSQAPSLGRQIGKSTEEAQGLMDKLFETWPEAKSFMDNINKVGSKTLRVFSPIQRPRHLWAYLHPDQFVHFAMNRRGPNSVMQGFASDIGFKAAWCIQREIYHTFLRPGLKFDGQLLIMVHDSMTNEVSLRFAPVMMYLIEHGMTTLVQNEYRDVFKCPITIPFGFDMKLGLNEGAMSAWAEMRHESAEKLIRQMAADGDKKHRNQLDDALYNMDKIWKVRKRELINDPYVMTLERKTDWYRDNIRGIQ